MFNKVSKYEADMEDSVMSFISSSLRYIESTFEWKSLLLIDNKCDRSAEDAYSSMAPDPAFAFVEGSCCPALDFVCGFWTMITFDTLLLRHFIYKTSSIHCISKC